MEYNGIDPNLLLAKMSNGDDDDKTLWLFLLLLMFGGRGGFGFGGHGDLEHTGVRDHASLQDLNAAQNALTSTIRDARDATVERTFDITRDQAANAARNSDEFARLSGRVDDVTASLKDNMVTSFFGLQGGQKDIQALMNQCCCDVKIGQKEIEAAICKCCCDIQNGLERGFAQVGYQLCEQTNVLQNAIHEDGEKTRALITANRMEDLQNALAIARDENSNLRQTEAILKAIRQECGERPFPPGPPR